MSEQQATTDAPSSIAGGSRITDDEAIYNERTGPVRDALNTLNLEWGASPHAITSAYRAMARENHSDVTGDEQVAEFTARFDTASKAREVLNAAEAGGWQEETTPTYADFLAPGSSGGDFEGMSAPSDIDVHLQDDFGRWEDEFDANDSPTVQASRDVRVPMPSQDDVFSKEAASVVERPRKGHALDTFASGLNRFTGTRFMAMLEKKQYGTAVFLLDSNFRNAAASKYNAERGTRISAHSPLGMMIACEVAMDEMNMAAVQQHSQAVHYGRTAFGRTLADATATAEWSALVSDSLMVDTQETERTGKLPEAVRSDFGLACPEGPGSSGNSRSLADNFGLIGVTRA